MREITEEYRGAEIKTAAADDEGVRIDNFLLRILKGVPRTLVYRVIRRGEVRVNKGRVGPGYRLVPGDEVRVPPLRMSAGPVVLPSPNLGKVSALRDAVLFENDVLMVVDKPCFMPAHGGSGVSYGLIEALRALRPDLRYLELAHRLDRETSGCLIVAKKRSALRKLHEQFREKDTRKRYVALVKGVFPAGTARVSAPLVKNVLRSGERIVKVDAAAGKPSVTEFAVRENLGGVTLVEARPLTGRTHQIRVHLAWKGHPILGDARYGDAAFDAAYRELGLGRMFLHAEEITFNDPATGAETTVRAPLPGDLAALLAAIRKKKNGA